MEGIIEGIKVYSAKGEEGRALSEGRLVENLGLEKDFHATGGERQISLLFTENPGSIIDSKEKGLCHSRFKENISIHGLAPDAALPGARLEAGEAVLEITGETKHCHEECVLFESGKTCSLAGQNLFAKVVKGGVIRTGDKVNVCINKGD